jgi:HlyD family secretion protein
MAMKEHQKNAIKNRLPKRGTRRTIYAALIIATLIGLAIWAFTPRPAPVELATASLGRFELSIEEYGKTRVRDRYTVYSPLSARIARIILREGDVVQAGADLASLTPVLAPMLDARTVQEQSERVAAREAMSTLANVRIERARVALQQASAERARSEKLAPDRFVSASKLEIDRLGELAAKKELASAIEERHVAEHEFELARAALRAVKEPGAVSGKSMLAIRAPISGTVLRVLQPNEGAVNLGTALLEIGDTKAMEIVAELLTTDALQAKPGTPVRIERWGGTGVLAGQVRRVEPAAFTKISALGVEEQRVNVIIDITSPHEQWQALGDGFRVSVRLITMAEENVLRVPVSAVFPLMGSAKPERYAAFIVREGRANLMPIEVHARNGELAWIRAGITAGEQVIIYPSAAVKDGARVVARTIQQ